MPVLAGDLADTALRRGRLYHNLRYLATAEDK